MNNYILQFILVLLSYGLYGKLCSKLELSLPTYGFNAAIIGFVIIAITFCLYNRKLIKNVPTSLKIFTIVSLISVFSTYQIELLKAICCVVVPIISYEVGLLCSNLYDYSRLNIGILSLYLGYALLSVISINQLLIYPENLLLHRDFTFCIVFFTPYLFLLKSKTIKAVFISSLFILIFVSAKRSLLLSLAFFFIVYYFVDIYINKNMNKTKKILWSIGVVCVLFVGLSYFEGSTYYDQLDERLSKLSEDGGSGRDKIYENVFSGVANASFSKLMFGHGYQSVEKDFDILAHNDLLEIAYDFGIISLAVWLYVIIYLFRRSLFFIRNKDFKRGALLLATLIFWQLIAETNCVIVTPEFSALIFMFFGIMNNHRNYYAKQRISKGIYTPGTIQ